MIASDHSTTVIQRSTAMNSSSTTCYSLSVCKTMPHDATYERHLMDFEKSFDSCAVLAWTTKHWKFIYLVIAIYLLAIFTGVRYMKSRSPFRIEGALLAWNAMLAAISIFCAWRTVTAILYQIQHVGLYGALCGGASLQFQQALGPYVLCTGITKILELGDTVFIVLRKKPLIFLHWFHHSSVCLLAWSACAYPCGIFLFFMTINFSVHSFVYSYFTLQKLKLNIPVTVNKVITLMQLMEMVLGVSVTTYTYRMLNTPYVGCCVYVEAIALATSIYSAYFVLFLNFFIRTYFFKQPLPAMLAKKLQ